MNNTNRIIGETVTHSSFGKGIIEDYDKRYIVINFSGKKRRFKFPDVFFDKHKFLKTNKRAMNLIFSNSKNHICRRCGEFSQKELSAETNMLCDYCLKEMFVCDECGKWAEKGNCTKDYYGSKLCEQCANETRFYCTECNRLLENSEMIKSKYLREDQKICGSCIEDMDFVDCHICGEYFPYEKELIVENTRICPECAQNKTFNCKKCGKKAIKINYPNNKLCDECTRLEKYYEHLDGIDFSDLKVEIVPFDKLKKTRTIALMTRLRSSAFSKTLRREDSFDVLLIRTYFGDLVVMYDTTNKFYCLRSDLNCGITLTEFKKIRCSDLLTKNRHVIEKTCLVRGYNRVFHIWEKPYLLRAQTEYDMDYGNRWEGEEIYEGNQYGDTNDFFILGYFV